ncbi:MAG: porin [Paracoccaceae bacterium]
MRFYKPALAVLPISLLASGAFAQDQPEDNRLKFSISGQINRGILFFDDGGETGEIFVDNDNSSTRLRATLSYDFGQVTIGGHTEFEFEFSSTAEINQINTDDSVSVANERKFELFVEGGFGRLSFGQGDSASNGASEVDLSGTTVVGYSGIADFAGGLLLRDGAGALTTSRIGNFFSNLDGNSRIERIRYDTPTYKGFTGSISLGQDDQEDLAIRYKNDYGDYKVAGAISYSTTNSRDRIHGSVSALHNPTGISLTFASGSDDLDSGARDPGFNYVKVGYQTNDLLAWGKTAFSIDYYDGSDIGAAGSDSESFALLAVQNIDRYNTEIYAGYRTYSVDSPGQTFQDLDGFLVGARFKF